MEDANFTEKYNRHSASFSLTDFSAQFNKEHFNVSPLNIRTGWTRVDQLECSLVPALHLRMVPLSSTDERKAFI